MRGLLVSASSRTLGLQDEFVVMNWIALGFSKLCHLWDLCRILPCSLCLAKNVVERGLTRLYLSWFSSLRPISFIASDTSFVGFDFAETCSSGISPWCSVWNTPTIDVVWAMIELVHTTMIVLWMMNLSWTLGHAGRLGHVSCFSANLVVHRSKVFVQCEVLHDPIFGSNFAIF